MRFSFQTGISNAILQDILDRADQDYYPQDADINPGNFTGSIAPHSNVSRISHTIAAGKRGVLFYPRLSMERDTAATTAGSVSITMTLSRSGTGTVILGQVLQKRNAVGANSKYEMDGRFWLEAGDKIEVKTNDPSTGGTVYYNLNLVIAEFDI